MQLGSLSCSIPPSRCSSPTAGSGSPLHTGSPLCLCGVPNSFRPAQGNKLLVVPLHNTCAEIHQPSLLSAKIKFLISEKNVPFTENDCSRSQLVGIAAHRPAQLGSRTNSKQTPVCTYQSKLYVPFANAVKTCCRHTAKSDLALARNVRLSLSRHLLCKLYEVDIAELQSEFDFFSLCACFTSHPDFIYTVTHTKADVKKRRQSCRPAGRVALPGPARLGAAAPHPRPRSAPAPPGTAHGRAQTRRARGDPGGGRSPCGNGRQRGGPRAARHGTARPRRAGKKLWRSPGAAAEGPEGRPASPAAHPRSRPPAPTCSRSVAGCHMMPGGGRRCRAGAERGSAGPLRSALRPPLRPRSSHAWPPRGRAPRAEPSSSGAAGGGAVRASPAAGSARGAPGASCGLLRSPAVFPSRLRAAPRGNGRAGRCSPWGRAQEAID